MMSDYIEERLEEHIESMKRREQVLLQDIEKLQVKLAAIEQERTELEAGLSNWRAEEEER